MTYEGYTLFRDWDSLEQRMTYYAKHFSGNIVPIKSPRTFKAEIKEWIYDLAFES